MRHFSDSREVLEQKRRRCIQLLVGDPSLSADVLSERLGVEPRTAARWLDEVRRGARPAPRKRLRPRTLGIESS